MSRIRTLILDPNRRMQLTMGLALVLSAAFALLAGLALGQTPTPTPEIAPSIAELLKEGQGVVTAFGEMGWVAGLTALVMFLIDLTKLGFIKAAIDRNDLRWIRPLLALLFGLIGGVALGLARDLPIGLALAEGVFAGIMSPGFHELWSIVSNKGREKRGSA